MAGTLGLVLSDLLLALRRSAADLIEPTRIRARQDLLKRDEKVQRQRIEAAARAEHVLIRLWDKAKDCPNYVKAEWNELSFFLKQVDVRPTQLNERGPTVVTRRVAVGDLQASPPQSLLTPDLRDRAVALHRSLAGVHDMAMEEWITGFERDADPEREILWWEWLVASYELLMQEPSIPHGSRQVAFGLLANLALGTPPSEVRAAAGLLPPGALEAAQACMQKAQARIRASGRNEARPNNEGS
jgi:hypothetical protein